MSGSLRSEREAGVLTLALARPDVRNALDETLIGELRTAIDAASVDTSIRVVVLSGDGKSFCAGADIGYMQRLSSFGHAENLVDAQQLSDLFLAISSCSKPVIAKVHGAAIGGGVGLVAAADIVIAAEGTRFALTEVRLGILPAVISPFVLRRLGPAKCRHLFLTGERFAARRALEIGLCDVVVSADELDAAVDATVQNLRAGGPDAQSACKRLLDEIGPLDVASAAARTPEFIAAQRATDEAKEGFAAFFEKRPAKWAKVDPEAGA